MTRCVLLAAVLALAGCKSDETRLTAIIGAVLIDGTGGAPVSDSVVIVSGTRVRAAGARAGVPVPAGSDKVDGRGKFLTPAVIDLSSERFEAPRAATLAEAEQAVQAGAKAIRGMVSDTSSLDAAWLGRLRALEVVFAPSLAETENPGDQFKTALANTGKMAAAGVRIAIASKPRREFELLLKAGLSPMDVVVAATRSGAAALKRQDQAGTIEPGKPATLLMLASNPLEDPGSLLKPDRVMRDGEWVQ